MANERKIDEAWLMSFCRDWLMGHESRDQMRREFIDEKIDFKAFKKAARERDWFTPSMESLNYLLN